MPCSPRRRETGGYSGVSLCAPSMRGSTRTGTWGGAGFGSAAIGGFTGGIAVIGRLATGFGGGFLIGIARNGFVAGTAGGGAAAADGCATAGFGGGGGGGDGGVASMIFVTISVRATSTERCSSPVTIA